MKQQRTRLNRTRRAPRPAAAGCDKQVKMWTLATNQSTVVGRHDEPIRHVFFLRELNNMLVTGVFCLCRVCVLLRVCV